MPRKRRFPRGKRGLKSPPALNQWRRLRRRFPRGKRGLKYLHIKQRAAQRKVASPAGSVD